MKTLLLILLLASLSAEAAKSATQQESKPSFSSEASPQSLQQDMATVNGYFDAVRDRKQGNASLANDRDPFQVTPELRSRSERRQSAKSLALPMQGSVADLSNIHIKAIVVSLTPFAVLSIEEGVGKTRDMVVHENELLQLGDGGLMRVRSIKRDGVTLHTGPSESDVVLIK